MYFSHQCHRFTYRSWRYNNKNKQWVGVFKWWWLTQLIVVTVSIVAKNSSCIGGGTGSLSLSAQGGSGGYSYSVTWQLLWFNLHFFFNKFNYDAYTLLGEFCRFQFWFWNWFFGSWRVFCGCKRWFFLCVFSCECYFSGSLR